ncbi:phosphotransferase [Spirosoma sp. HMF4905]|uniref:Phosphotransferase n=1 Tax=Spirosoma arboris TaxID=2682092 RepID=A0A7K1SMM7_9BACT|nr:aminoglycoside phosphotransferase family protein [Spirosoma arboris]MVM35055.1 phosphotransferase [Spirosoma arboris]
MLEQFKTTIVTYFPELAEASFSLLTMGWDSIAVDVDDKFLFKFPREDDGVEALRREAAMLAIVRPRLTLLVPDLEFFDAPQPFSKHTKLKGNHLVTTQYELLTSNAKQRLAEAIARFYAELHAIEPELLQTAGALPGDQWPTPEIILAGIQPYLSKVLLVKAEKTLDTWARLPDDPHGITYGFFDGHGWNMAFDHEKQRLTGIYDFGDSGFGELHEEFIYTSFISPELTLRVIAQYELLTGRLIDRERVSILTGVLLLVELADMGDDPKHGALVLQNALAWLANH